ncbi:MAG: hypothetical protein JWM31_1200, partial [Solirubrobacterales bacterium]|nr:hypothetical protein [Solirubrobacterales bacterium]
MRATEGEGPAAGPRAGRRLRLLLGIAALAVTATPAAPASAAERLPVYRDPPGYRGIAMAPATVAPQPPVPVPLTAAGTFPDAVVDEAGTAHVVWNEDRGDAADV